MSRFQLTHPPSQNIGGSNLSKINTNLNSSESVELGVVSAARLETELLKPYNQKILNHNKNKVSIDSLLQKIVDEILKFQPNYFFQGRIPDVEQILRECEWTNLLKEMVEYGNKHVLTSFQYRIMMED